MAKRGALSAAPDAVSAASAPEIATAALFQARACGGSADQRTIQPNRATFSVAAPLLASPPSNRSSRAANRKGPTLDQHPAPSHSSLRSGHDLRGHRIRRHGHSTDTACQLTGLRRGRISEVRRNELSRRITRLVARLVEPESPINTLSPTPVTSDSSATPSLSTALPPIAERTAPSGAARRPPPSGGRLRLCHAPPSASPGVDTEAATRPVPLLGSYRRPPKWPTSSVERAWIGRLDDCYIRRAGHSAGRR